MELMLAIMWTVALVCDIITCALGSAPTWVLVFCPLIILVLDKWEAYFKSKM